MPDTKGSALDAASALDGTEIVYVVQGGSSKRSTTSAISISTIDTRAAIAAATIAAGVTHIRTAGYASVADGGGALYERGVSEF